MIEVYDTLSPEIRAIIRDCPYDLDLTHAKRWTVRSLRRKIAAKRKLELLAAYGPNHPQLAIDIHSRISYTKL